MAIYRGAGGSGDAVNDSSSEATITVQARDEAIAAKNAAQAAQTAAQLAETNAETAEANAEFSETNAATSASNAASSASSAASSASSASTSATNAANSASSAASSLAAIGSSETNAANSATAAATSASQAATSATNASNSASAASTSASNASSSASTASTSASQAATSATAASNSASAANTSATNAATSATSASNSASAASTSATNAASSASAASTSATNAASSASSASTSATTATTQAGIATTKASEANTSATNAATSETNAATSETNAAGSASAASTSASNAATSATNAASSASSASTSASTATTQAGIATTQASNASTSATNAATSETNAAASASAAATSASNASTSASSAASAQSAAETARDQTLAAFDSFDDRYLGQKSTAPTLDNDGDALVAGALYFNTTTNEMKVYDGTQWLNAYASLSGALLATSNLSDLNNVSTARDNLGLGTAAVEDVGYFATAAQGTNADTAYGWGNHASAGYLASSNYTASDVLNKIKTVDGAGSGLDADLLDGNSSAYFQQALVSGTNIKTVNSTTLLGSGNLAVGTVTSVGGTGTVSGLTLSGTVTGTGNLTLGGTLSLTSGNVTTALGYTPYNSTNPSGYVNTAGARSALSFTEGSGAYNSSTGVITIPTNTNQLTNGAGFVTSSGVTSVAAGNGMTFTTITGTGTVTMGTPGTLTNTSTNSVSAGTHTHELTGELVTTTTGSAPYYGARAWVNFNGTGTVAIRASGNVTSITDNGTGIYTVNFTNAMPDVNYATSMLVRRAGTQNSTWYGSVSSGNATAQYDVNGVALYVNNASGTPTDADIVCLTVFR